MQPGERLSHYIIEDQLGQGGMGVVYRARDEVLQRTVALKLLPAEVAADRARRERFLFEARAASALNHPGITTIYELGEDAGRHFIAMEYIAGRSLRQVIQQGGLELGKTLEIAAAAAEALSAAHLRGIVHRDIKPDNIMVADAGGVKILDFGVAKLREPVVEDQVTADAALLLTRGTVGTPAYMSPEQAAGAAVDQRSDIYSLGLVLFELLAGHRLTPGATLDRLPGGLREIICKAVAEIPEARYAQADELAADLRALIARPPVRPRRLPFWVAAAIALVFVLGAILGSRLFRRTPAERPAVAVLYVQNLTRDASLDWLNTGLAEMLITNLSRVGGFDVLSPERVQSALQQSRGAPAMSPGVAQEVARHAGATVFLTGAILKVGPERLRLDIRGQDTAGGQILFSETAEAESAARVFTMVDELTARIGQRLAPGAAGSAPAIEEAATANVEAYRHYQAGRDYCRRFLMPEGQREFEEAVRLDPQFALAHFELARLLGWQGDPRRQGEALEKAVRWRSRLSRREQLTLDVERAAHAGDSETQTTLLRVLLEEFPRESEARARLSSLMRQGGQAPAAVALIRQGLALDARDDALWNELCYAELDHGNTAAALEANDRYRELRPQEPNPWDTRGDILAAAGRLEEAIAAYRKALEIRPDFFAGMTYTKITLAELIRRNFSEAQRLIEEYAQRLTHSRFRHYLRWHRGLLLEAQGRIAPAQQEYRRAIADLNQAGETAAAGSLLLAMADQASLLGRGAAVETLAFARRQKLLGEEAQAVAVLEAMLGNHAAAERALEEHRAARPWLALQVIERQRNVCRLYAALAKEDGDAALRAAAALPRNPEAWQLMAQARAALLAKDYAAARRDLERTRNAMLRSLPQYSPLRAAIIERYLESLTTKTPSHPTRP